MTKISMLIGAATALLVGACAHHDTSANDTSAPAASSYSAPAATPQVAPPVTQTPAPSPQAQVAPSTSTAAYTDSQLANFAATQAELAPISRQPQTTEAERQAVVTQMRAVLARHNLTGAQYNEIVAAVRADPALAQRLAAAAQSNPG